MPFAGFIGKAAVWVIDDWQAWLAFTILSFAGYTVWYFLVERRLYKEVSGKLYVRHGRLGKWLDVEQHLKEEHKEEIRHLQLSVAIECLTKC